LHIGRDPEDYALRADVLGVEVTAAVLPGERVDVRPRLGPADRLDDVPSNLGIAVGVVALPDRDRDP
jgi:hypothetical protein